MRTLLTSLLLASTGLAHAFTLTPLPLAAPADASAMNLARAAGDSVLVSWVERLPDSGHRLMIQRCALPTPCAAAKEIARGNDWLVNWADLPALAQLFDGSLWAQDRKSTRLNSRPYCTDRLPFPA